MENWLKITSSKSSVVVLPTISPTALTSIRQSAAANSSVAPARNASCFMFRAADMLWRPRDEGNTPVTEVNDADDREIAFPINARISRI
jgi:hypothetical protein